jgi:signal transduction histidine kinase
VPEAQLAFNWGNFLQGLGIAASIALMISIGAAYFLARSIARPLIRMTQASEAIAQGDYNQRIESAGKGEDEISRLGLSFNRMAQEVDRSQQTMRDFVANVSHELKTPLTSIQGFSQAVLDGTADSRPLVEHSVTVIYDEAARMRRLVDELLDLSRIESGQIEFNRRELDLRRLLERLVIKLAPQAVQKGIHFNLTLDAYQTQLPGPRSKAAHDQPTLRGISDNNLVGPLVWGDADRLEQVFTNIIDNAIKYSPESGEVLIELKLIEVGEHLGFNRALVTISNTGPLIPLEQLPRIFERFYKLDKSRAKKKGDSTGLGLAIAKELLEAHNGKIQVQSQLITPANYPFPVPATEGLTTFTISLPLVGLPKITPALPESIPALPQ